MFAFWSRFRRGTSAAVLTCWIWFSMAAAFTHVCGRPGSDHSSSLNREGVTCVSCLWAAVEKSADVTPAPTAPEQTLCNRVFLHTAETHPYVPSLVLPGRAPPA